MNLYAHDLSLFGFTDFSDPILDSLSRTSPESSSTDLSTAVDDRPTRNHSPPRHRHDGTSPLPLGMDWSLPPHKWDGRNSVWPLDPHTGWSYCVTVPSWTILPKSRGSDYMVFYRVQVGIQSPEGITTIRGVLRRFSNFLKLLSDLKKAFPKKNLPPAPPRRLLKIKSKTLVEERRSSLEDWMEKLLSDIDVSRSASVADFLELEAAARSSFNEADHTTSDAHSSAGGMPSSFSFTPTFDSSALAGSSSIASDYGDESAYEISELGTPRHGRDTYSEHVMENFTYEQEFFDSVGTPFKHGGGEKGDEETGHTSSAKTDGEGKKLLFEQESHKLAGHVRRLSIGSAASDLSSVRASEISNLGATYSLGDCSLDFPESFEAPRTIDTSAGLDSRCSRDLVVVLPSEVRQKFSRVLITMQRRLATAKTDMEDLIARLNQELAVRQYLTTKVKDLEVELETTNQNCKENMQQAVLNERERFTQMQWDMEELRSKCFEMELKLKTAQDENLHTESTKVSIIKENEVLMRELDVAREQLENLQKHNEELELKSKADVKLLVKEVKSLRISQSELKQELSRMMKEKLEVERLLQREKQRKEHANTANAKLLRECEILRNRLQECSVNFLIEEEDKLTLDTSSPSDAVDLLTTSDNRIGLLLAEAQLLAQDVENAASSMDKTPSSNDGGTMTTDDQLRKMLTDIFIDNATLRKQVNSVIRCALNTPEKSEKDEEEDEVPLRRTVLSKFLER